MRPCRSSNTRSTRYPAGRALLRRPNVRWLEGGRRMQSTGRTFPAARPRSWRRGCLFRSIRDRCTSLVFASWWGADCTAAFANSFLYSRRAPREIDSRAELFLRQIRDLPREKPPLRLVCRQSERGLVRRTCLRYPAESATQIRASRVCEVILAELRARQQVIDEMEALLRTFAHGDGHRAVELDDRRWLNRDQPVVEEHDLAPVRGRSGRALGVDGGDSRLKRVGTEAVRRERVFGERNAFGDLLTIPSGPILLLEQDQFSVRRRARGAARLLEQHEAQQAHHLRFREQLDQQPAQTYRLPAQLGAGWLRRISLVEDEVDHMEDRRQPGGQVVAPRHLVRNCLGADDGLGAHDALGERRRRHEKGARDLFRRQAADFAQRERDLSFRRQRGMTAGEDQTQAIIFDFLVV